MAREVRCRAGSPRGEWKSWRLIEAPCPCEPRTAAMWQPLFAIAAYFGGGWPERALDAFEELAGSNAVKEPRFLAFLRHPSRSCRKTRRRS